MEHYYVTGKTLFDGTGRDPVEDVILEIKDGTIIRAAVKSRFSFASVDHNKIVDFSDFFLMPGLIDAHVHLCLNAGTSHTAVVEDLMREHETGVLPVRMIRNYFSLLKGGITTVRDCGCIGWGTVELREAVRQDLITGPRLLISGIPITTPKGHLNYMGLPSGSRSEINESLTQLREKEVDFLKVCVTGGIMTSESNPYWMQFTTDDLQYIVDDAHARGKKITGHVLCTDGILQAVETGFDSIEHCVWKNDEGFDYDEDIAGQLLKSGVKVHATFTGADRELLEKGDFEEEDYQLNLESLREKFQYHRAMLNAGIEIVCTSDAGVRWTRFDEFWRSLAVMVEALEVTPVDAIRAATSQAAMSIGIEETTGTIENGKSADILVINGDPLSNINDLQNVHRVICRGRTLDPNAIANTWL